MKKILIIKADTNDADYVHRITKVTDKQLEKIQPVIDAIRAQEKRFNWPEYEGSVNEKYKDIDPKLIEIFSEYVPSWEHGVHSIDEIIVYEVKSITELL